MRLTTELRAEGLAGRAGGWERDEELDEEVVLDVGRLEEVEEV